MYYQTVVLSRMTTTVSAKIPDDLKREIEAEGVNISAVIREALEREVARRKRERLKADAEDLRRRLGGKVDVDDVVDAVRETRRER